MAKNSPKPADTFWTRIRVPINHDWKENHLEFVNPVQVADLFVEAGNLAALLAQEAEVITETVARLDFEKSQAVRDMKKFRRGVLSRHFKGLAKSANAEMADAYLVSVLSDEELAAFEELEAEIEHLTDNIGAWNPRLEKIRARLKQLERNMEYLKQFLDFDKLQSRITNPNLRR